MNALIAQTRGSPKNLLWRVIPGNIIMDSFMDANGAEMGSKPPHLSHSMGATVLTGKEGSVRNGRPESKIITAVVSGRSFRSSWYQAYYITTARELTRMVGIRKAPILHHFSDSIAGKQIFMILVTMARSAIDPSLAGLVATYGLNLNVLQAWVIWNLCNVENKMICVERILQFSSIPLIIQDCRPEPEWPMEGKIELQNIHIQYDPAGPMVLKGVTCTFPGQKKIGVVGRTGSGKSTLLVRSKLGIIPQDPTLFLGTVRTNLDPLEQHADKELWEVLKKCHLAEIVRQDPRLLDAPVAENGENWSLGQKGNLFVLLGCY